MLHWRNALPFPEFPAFFSPLKQLLSLLSGNMLSLDLKGAVLTVSSQKSWKWMETFVEGDISGERRREVQIQR